MNSCRRWLPPMTLVHDTLLVLQLRSYTLLSAQRSPIPNGTVIRITKRCYTMQNSDRLPASPSTLSLFLFQFLISRQNADTPESIICNARRAHLFCATQPQNIQTYKNHIKINLLADKDGNCSIIYYKHKFSIKKPVSCLIHASTSEPAANVY